MRLLIPLTCTVQTRHGLKLENIGNTLNLVVWHLAFEKLPDVNTSTLTTPIVKDVPSGSRSSPRNVTSNTSVSKYYHNMWALIVTFFSFLTYVMLFSWRRKVLVNMGTLSQHLRLEIHPSRLLLQSLKYTSICISHMAVPC